ncbi:MAG TPA: RidA family protein, partial [Gemmatimonadaceae bacterium]|nr:RidA family protein [Gemmatimonadaceae bacterium]
DWTAPRGYSNGVAASGTTVFVAGQIGWNARCEFESDDFVDQVRQALLNVRAVLAEAGATPEHLVRLNWFVADGAAYRAARRELGRHWRAIMGEHYPPMSAVIVAGLLEERALLEIEATAVVPE